MPASVSLMQAAGVRSTALSLERVHVSHRVLDQLEAALAMHLTVQLGTVVVVLGVGKVDRNLVRAIVSHVGLVELEDALVWFMDAEGRFTGDDLLVLREVNDVSARDFIIFFIAELRHERNLVNMA